MSNLPVPRHDPLPVEVGLVQTEHPVNINALTDPIPEIKRRYREDGQFYYVDIEYCMERLNNAFGPGNWSFVPMRVSEADGQTEKGDPKVEITVEGRLYAAGIISTGIVGVGAGMYFASSPRATYANAYATAISEATKNAARKMGIGLDIKDRDAQKLEQAQETLGKVVETMAVNGHKKKVFDVLVGLVPQAITGDEEKFEFKHWLVDENQIDAVKKSVLMIGR